MASSSLPVSAPGLSGFAAHSAPSSSRRQPPSASLSPPRRIGSVPPAGSHPNSPSYASHHNALPHSRSMVSLDSQPAEMTNSTQSLGRPHQNKSLPRPPHADPSHRRSESLAPSPPRQHAVSEAPPRRSEVSRPHALLDVPVVNGLHINSPRDPISGETILSAACVSIGTFTPRLQGLGAWTRALCQ